MSSALRWMWGQVDQLAFAGFESALQQISHTSMRLLLDSRCMMAYRANMLSCPPVGSVLASPCLRRRVAKRETRLDVARLRSGVTAIPSWTGTDALLLNRLLSIFKCETGDDHKLVSPCTTWHIWNCGASCGCGYECHESTHG